MRVDIGDGVRLFVDIDGIGLVADGPAMRERPTLVYLHGGPGLDHTLYKTTERNPLGEVAQLVLYDHRGNGRSDWRTRDEWNLDTWADDVVRLCDALGIERPIVLGASFGGFVAQRYIARHPDHPSKVVLACTAARLDLDVMDKTFSRLGGEAAGQAARRFFGGDFEAFPEFLQHCTPLYSTNPLDLEAMARAVMNVEVMTHFFGGEAQTMDLRPGLASARCPVLVLGGELDPVMPVELNEEVASCLPANLARFEVLPGISHLEVSGEAAAPLLRQFILAED
jgi:pimeloyl-ACP methyl ester carboxylesterase